MYAENYLVKKEDFCRNRDFSNYIELRETSKELAMKALEQVKNNFGKGPYKEKYRKSRRVGNTYVHSLGRVLLESFLHPTRYSPSFQHRSAQSQQSQSPNEQILNNQRLRETATEFETIANSVALSRALTKLLVLAWIRDMSLFYSLSFQPSAELIEFAHRVVLKILREWPHVPNSGDLDDG